ncbi:helix-turn-helix domain-containing protein [Lacticaseibacillus baoqingensis]|uniref:Helix-turn-helix domain-containing protein n=1 Tax=Lacticaseibacillus baoqingensis TaxID=2486013 RepID=A0ABW4E6G8_9LACO|nr:helix-turn-helix domain-containing protein [Lacticaseibacillus baoqingensis]
MALMQKQHGDIFLSSSALDRLNLYKVIRQLRLVQSPVDERLAAQKTGAPLVKEVNLRQVANLTGRNYGSIYNIYNDLLGVLGGLVGNEHAPLAELFAIPEGQLRFHMIAVTDPFQFMQAVMDGEYESFEDFVAALGMSRMTVTRHLRPMRELAQTFGVQLQPDTLSFNGDERRLRLFVTMMYWQATAGAVWPFKQLSHATAERLVDTLYTALDTEPANLVARELSMYYLAVCYWRISNNHILTYDRSKAVMDYPLPNLDLALGHGRFKDFTLPPLSRQQLMGETEYGFFLMHFAPVYLTAGDQNAATTIERFRRYAGSMYQLVAHFVQAFPEWSQDLSDADQQLLIVNLLTITCGTLALGEDFHQHVAYTFNRSLQAQADDPRYERVIRQTITQVVLADHLEQYIDRIDSLTENYYRNLLQLRAAFHPQRVVRVALVLDQTTLEYVDLIAMLSQQAFVELLPSGADLIDADLVIQSGSLPLPLPAGVAGFEWTPNASADRFGELFAILVSLWRNKRAGAIDSQRRA